MVRAGQFSPNAGQAPANFLPGSVPRRRRSEMDYAGLLSQKRAEESSYRSGWDPIGSPAGLSRATLGDPYMADSYLGGGGLSASESALQSLDTFGTDGAFGGGLSGYQSNPSNGMSFGSSMPGDAGDPGAQRRQVQENYRRDLMKQAQADRARKQAEKERDQQVDGPLSTINKPSMLGASPAHGRMKSVANAYGDELAMQLEERRQRQVRAGENLLTFNQQQHGGQDGFSFGDNTGSQKKNRPHVSEYNPEAGTVQAELQQQIADKKRREAERKRLEAEEDAAVNARMMEQQRRMCEEVELEQNARQRKEQGRLKRQQLIEEQQRQALEQAEELKRANRGRKAGLAEPSATNQWNGWADDRSAGDQDPALLKDLWKTETPQRQPTPIAQPSISAEGGGGGAQLANVSHHLADTDAAESPPPPPAPAVAVQRSLGDTQRPQAVPAAESPPPPPAPAVAVQRSLGTTQRPQAVPAAESRPPPPTPAVAVRRSLRATRRPQAVPVADRSPRQTPPSPHVPAVGRTRGESDQSPSPPTTDTNPRESKQSPRVPEIITKRREAHQDACLPLDDISVTREPQQSPCPPTINRSLRGRERSPPVRAADRSLPRREWSPPLSTADRYLKESTSPRNEQRSLHVPAANINLGGTQKSSPILTADIRPCKNSSPRERQRSTPTPAVNDGPREALQAPRIARALVSLSENSTPRGVPRSPVPSTADENLRQTLRSASRSPLRTDAIPGETRPCPPAPAPTVSHPTSRGSSPAAALTRRPTPPARVRPAGRRLAAVPAPTLTSTGRVASPGGDADAVAVADADVGRREPPLPPRPRPAPRRRCPFTTRPDTGDGASPRRPYTPDDGRACRASRASAASGQCPPDAPLTCRPVTLGDADEKESHTSAFGRSEEPANIAGDRTERLITSAITSPGRSSTLTSPQLERPHIFPVIFNSPGCQRPHGSPVPIPTRPVAASIAFSISPVRSKALICTSPVRPAIQTCTSPVRPAIQTCTSPVRPAIQTCTSPVRPAIQTCTSPVRPAIQTCTSPVRSAIQTCTSPVRPVSKTCTSPVTSPVGRRRRRLRMGTFTRRAKPQLSYCTGAAASPPADTASPTRSSIPSTDRASRPERVGTPRAALEERLCGDVLPTTATRRRWDRRRAGESPPETRRGRSLIPRRSLPPGGRDPTGVERFAWRGRPAGAGLRSELRRPLPDGERGGSPLAEQTTSSCHDGELHPGYCVRSAMHSDGDFASFEPVESGCAAGEDACVNVDRTTRLRHNSVGHDSTDHHGLDQNDLDSSGWSSSALPTVTRPRPEPAVRSPRRQPATAVEAHGFPVASPRASRRSPAPMPRLGHCSPVASPRLSRGDLRLSRSERPALRRLQIMRRTLENQHDALSMRSAAAQTELCQKRTRDVSQSSSSPSTSPVDRRNRRLLGQLETQIAQMKHWLGVAPTVIHPSNDTADLKIGFDWDRSEHQSAANVRLDSPELDDLTQRNRERQRKLEERKRAN